MAAILPFPNRDFIGEALALIKARGRLRDYTLGYSDRASVSDVDLVLEYLNELETRYNASA